MINKLNRIQFGILLFWTLWFTLVAFSDITNFFQTIHLLSLDFPFNSNNYNLVERDFLIYNIHSKALILFTFSAIVFWAILIAILFWITLFLPRKKLIDFTFLLSISLTSIFILSDEFFIQYSLEHGHILRLILQLVTFLYFYEKNLQIQKVNN